MDKETYELITKKKDFSKLPKADVERAYTIFKKRQVSDIEKIRLTRELLHKIFGVFTSKKLLSPKDKDFGWILRKHISTKERLMDYGELYERLLEKKKQTIIDLGAGVNGFSYTFLPKGTDYVAVEAVGQLVDLMNDYLKKNKISGKAIHESLFEIEKIRGIIKKTKKPRVVFLFKIIDSLEMLERNYSKKLLEMVAPLADKVVVSFATRSLRKGTRFKANRKWIVDFIEDNFKLLEDFELGKERYVVFKSNEGN